MALSNLLASIRADIRRPWDLRTTASLVGTFVFLGSAKLWLYWPKLLGEQFPLGRVYVCAAYALLAFFVAAFLSLLRRGVPKIVPGALLILVVGLGWLEMMLALMWLPFLVTEIVRRLLSS
jgi:hypothetical protein